MKMLVNFRGLLSAFSLSLSNTYCAGYFYANLTQVEPFGKREPQLRKCFY